MIAGLLLSALPYTLCCSLWFPSTCQQRFPSAGPWAPVSRRSFPPGLHPAAAAACSAPTFSCCQNVALQGPPGVEAPHQPHPGAQGWRGRALRAAPRCLLLYAQNRFPWFILLLRVRDKHTQYTTPATAFLATSNLKFYYTLYYTLQSH